MRDHDISQRRACRLVCVDPKTARRDRLPDSAEIRKRIQEIAGTHRRFGYRRIGVLLERESLRGSRITPGECERRRGLRLRLMYRHSGPSLLVAEGRLNATGQAVVSRSKTGRGNVTAPFFLLVRQVKLPKRLDLTRNADRALDSVPGLIVANWVEGR